MKIFENFINEMAVNPVADKMRQDLKAKGYKVPAQISVTSERGAYRITIKDLKIDDEEVKKIVKKHESYDRDVKTGEILAGGNTFVFVDYDYDVQKKESQRLKSTVEKFVDQAMSDKGRDVKLKNGYVFGVFTNTTDKDAENIKKGYTRPYEKMFYVKKNGKDVSREFGQLWWVLVKAGY